MNHVCGHGCDSRQAASTKSKTHAEEGGARRERSGGCGLVKSMIPEGSMSGMLRFQ